MLCYKALPGTTLEATLLTLGLQGGPHNNTIGGIAVCLGHAQTPEFKAYQTQVC